MAKKKVFALSEHLANGLEETISAAQNYSGELRIDIIPIRKIETDPDNPRDLALTFEDLHKGLTETDNEYTRKSEEINSLQSMAHSIKNQGVINPVVVYKYGEKYRLVAGERRTLASILAGKIDIQAKILDSKPSELRISLLQWIENIERSDLSLYERLRNLEKIVAVYARSKGTHTDEITITEFSNLIGCAKSHASNYKAVLSADEELKKFIFENKIKNLEKAAVIAGITSKEIKQHAINACLEGATLKKLKTIVEQSQLRKQRQKVSEKRGRQAVSIQLGATKNINVAKIILDSVLKNNALAHLAEQFKKIEWNDYRSINETFKILVRKLEELNA
jgi:ParB family chromosome partitioning protein